MKLRRFSYILGVSLPILAVFLCCVSLSVYVEYEKKVIREKRSTVPISRIFDNPACLPPCWNNIEPGVSTREDVLIFRDQLEEGTFEFATAYEEAHYIFKFKDQKTGSRRAGVRLIFNDANFVELIEFYAHTFSKIPLWYALQFFGEPEYAIVNEFRRYPMESLVLYYPGSGIEITCLSEPIPAPVIGITIGSIDCELDSNIQVYFYSPDIFFDRLVAEYGSLEKAEYAKQFFCPWVGVEADYLSVDWGAMRYPGTPTALPAEIMSRCPSRK